MVKVCQKVTYWQSSETQSCLEGPTQVDFEIQKLRQLLRDAPNDGLKGTIRAMLSHSDQRDYFKLKEFFLNVCESFKELPETVNITMQNPIIFNLLVLIAALS